MFTTLIVQPIFNVLAFIYAIVPGHNFGVALIIFTILSRYAMWPLLKKQLYQAKAMRNLQPELKKIKQATKGDKQKESLLMMELYKEKGINPFSQIGLIILQLPVFFALYAGINKIVNDKEQIVNFSYSFIRELPWMKELAAGTKTFDSSLFGVIDLDRAARGSRGWYLPALAIVIASAVLQYFVSKQLAPNVTDKRGLRAILKDAQEGKMADQSDVNAAVTNKMLLLTPLLIGFVTLGIPAALGLYILVGSIVAYFQQKKILESDEVALEAVADGQATEAVLLETAPNKPIKTKKSSAKRRKRKR